SKWLTVILLTSLSTSSILFFGMFCYMPLFTLNADCGSFFCNSSGQLILMCIQIGVVPPILIEWIRRISSTDNKPAMSSMAVMISGATLIVSGILSETCGYGVNIFLAFLLSMFESLIAIVLYKFFDFNQNTKSKETAGRARISLDLITRDLFFIVPLIVLGLSICKTDDYLFSLFTGFGITMVIIASVALLVNVHHGGRKTGLFFLEGIILAILLTVTTSMYFFYKDSIIETCSRLPPFLIGIGFGYFWMRMIEMVLGHEYQKLFKIKVLIHVSRGGMNKFSMFFYLIGLSILSFLQISPSLNDINMYYHVGLLMFAIALVTWSIAIIKLELSLRQPRK
ncbi:MAG: hypothetical protein ACTSWN_12060, partial [Promethearchaeota archaeon]